MPWYSDHKAVVATISIPATGMAKKASATVKTALINSSTEIKAYPNPSNGIVTLVSSENVSSQVSVYNLEGRKILNKSINLSSNYQNTLDLSAFSNGVYFIKVDSYNNSQTIKIIKK